MGLKSRFFFLFSVTFYYSWIKKTNLRYILVCTFYPFFPVRAPSNSILYCSSLFYFLLYDSDFSNFSYKILGVLLRLVKGLDVILCEENINFLLPSHPYYCVISIQVFIIYLWEEDCRQLLHRRFLLLYQRSCYSRFHIYHSLPHIQFFIICAFLYLLVSALHYIITNLWLFALVYLLVHHCKTPDFRPQTYRSDKKLRLNYFTKSHWDCGLLFYHSLIWRCGNCWIIVFIFVFIFPIKDSALSSFSLQGFRGFTKAGLESK